MVSCQRHASPAAKIRRPILSQRATAERTARELARGTMTGSYRQRYLLPLFAAVQNCTLDGCLAAPMLAVARRLGPTEKDPKQGPFCLTGHHRQAATLIRRNEEYSRLYERVVDMVASI
jgi:hypothetical protein